jgi:acyl dehydratase
MSEVTLPPRAIAVTRTLIVAGALASRDFERVHHDVEIARASGAKDIFLNILTTQGLIGAWVGAWAGPRARITAMSLRLGMPAYPGDTLTLTGRVAAEGTLEVRGAVARGDHVTGTVTLV